MINFIKRIIKLSILVFTAIIFIAIFTHIMKSKDKISLSYADMLRYIETSDKISKGKLQVNWKNLVAIDSVRHEKNLASISNNDIEELGNRFIEKKSTSYKNFKSKYRLRKLDEVLNDLNFEEKERKKVYEYLEQLKYKGLTRNELNESSSNIKFIEEISDDAINVFYDYGILPSIIISQAILESGWGKSKLYTEGNNIFGIKADTAWNGDAIQMNTTEFHNDEITASFRKYFSKKESLEDYAKFLHQNKRYAKNGVFNASHYTEQAKALENAGYSTRQNESGEKIYAKLLISIIKEYNLQLIDSKAQSVE
ncbi:mannosyl-glycoprotein endo-beta-N-acetylglucosamidase [Gottschalkia purinilytica]|uniref:Mannosyl-glycoprotein endo-beta-N-acetylglucosamidase n=1 Tax=Gottschalkia purinilytica TaxID=1503 RepID=A0A0L0WF06_GOTPU|nr:glucosaminidase domain-containing protein [Gottschalkia purinilytica]KNF10000.1 mannosyl-glycoprotein endo-beta-N-acetylglucosamidase [Gottschalkia purinilytica]